MNILMYILEELHVACEPPWTYYKELLYSALKMPFTFMYIIFIDVFLPCPDNLLVNLAESRELVKDLLNQFPTKFLNSHDTNSALGPALQAAYKLMVSFMFPFLCTVITSGLYVTCMEEYRMYLMPRVSVMF
jgi:hypothetical protein